MPLAAGLAAELKILFQSAEINVQPSPLKSEFAVSVNGTQVFSRLKLKRYPEKGEIAAICADYD
jgi:hypothetical protein